MTIAVDMGRKATKTNKKQTNKIICVFLAIVKSDSFVYRQILVTGIEASNDFNSQFSSTSQQQNQSPANTPISNSISIVISVYV